MRGCDGKLRGHQLAVFQHLRLRPFGQVLRDWLVERELAFVQERQRACSDHRFAHALQPEDRVLGHWLAGLDVLPAERLKVAAPAVVMGECDDTGDILGGHMPL
jgi:hypothetical protein